MPTFDLGGRTAVITGATGAIGSAVARTLVESGAKVALIARNRRRLERLCARFPEEAETLVCSADVSSAYDLVEARDKVLEELGEPDLVVTAAGVRRAANFDEAIPADWRRMLATNLRGTLQTVQTFSPDVLAAGERGDRADIVMLSSAPARERQHAYSVFSSLGASLGQFSKHLRAEYGLRGVRVHYFDSIYTGGSFFTQSNLGSNRATSDHHDVIQGPLPELESIAIDTAHVAEEVGFAASLPAHVNMASATILPLEGN